MDHTVPEKFRFFRFSGFFIFALVCSRGQTEAASKKMKKIKVVRFDELHNFVTIQLFASGLRLASRGQNEVIKQ